MCYRAILDDFVIAVRFCWEDFVMMVIDGVLLRGCFIVFSITLSENWH